MTWKRLANRLALAGVFGWCAAACCDLGLAAIDFPLARRVAEYLGAIAGVGMAIAMLALAAFFWSAVDE
jgi:hypothetical protein